MKDNSSIPSNASYSTSCDSDYIPIDCEVYSRYEVAIMHSERLRLAWRDPDGSLHVAAVSPVNLRSHNRAEYLLAKNIKGHILELRLDYILRAESCHNTD